MALYIPHSIFHMARLLYVRPETFGPYYVHCLSSLFKFQAEQVWLGVMQLVLSCNSFVCFTRELASLS